MDDLKYWVAFNRIHLMGTVRLRLLERYFSTMEEAWSASKAELRGAGIDEKTAAAILSRRVNISPDDEMECLGKSGVIPLNWHHPIYPTRLKEIPDPPPVLYLKGTIQPEDERSVAIVGTRKATAYGREAAIALTSDLARNGVTIVSGLARGIDSIAHRTALDLGRRTIAVLANGLDIIYPRENTRLTQEITERGALISEYPLGMRPDARNFPRRNRLMSGITLGTLVVEAGETSGALWTVSHALEQDREVFCVPGSIFSSASWSTNRLIQEGAKLVIDYKDVLEELNLTGVTHQMEMRIPTPAPEGEETRLLGYLSQEPIHIDEIRRNSRLPINVVSSTLTVMELKGLVKQVGGMHYIRAREVAAQYGA